MHFHKFSASKLLFESFKLSSLCSRIFSPTTPNRSAGQVKQLPWVLTALSSCGVRFVGGPNRGVFTGHGEDHWKLEDVEVNKNFVNKTFLDKILSVFFTI